MELSSGGEGHPWAGASSLSQESGPPSLQSTAGPHHWDGELIQPHGTGRIQLSKPTKVKKILFHLSLFLQMSIKITQGVMLSLYQDGLAHVLLHTGWKEREAGPALMLHLLLLLGGTTHLMFHQLQQQPLEETRHGNTVF